MGRAATRRTTSSTRCAVLPAAARPCRIAATSSRARAPPGCTASASPPRPTFATGLNPRASSTAVRLWGPSRTRWTTRWTTFSAAKGRASKGGEAPPCEQDARTVCQRRDERAHAARRREHGTHSATAPTPRSLHRQARNHALGPDSRLFVLTPVFRDSREPCCADGEKRIEARIRHLCVPAEAAPTEATTTKQHSISLSEARSRSAKGEAPV
mmetsp:Transcript_11761/g.34027  ORF Transcript_11761/g.34027 Transcript_11761/m.34027 type:complete len:213 (+) Transcript_11761:172-810(+)